MRKLTLDSVYVNNTLAIRNKKQGRLLDFISKRCTWEFRALHKIFHNLQTFKQKCSEAKLGILACVQGNREECIKHCRACYLHRRNKADRHPRCLPDAQYVHDLSDADKNKITLCMDKKLGIRAVENQRYNLNTNMCESSHRTTQRSLPKTKT
jgi:hypothetical protein